MKIFCAYVLGLVVFAALALSGCGGGGGSTGLSPAPHGKWTVLVYMNAANDLDAYSSVNMQQMQQVAANSNVSFVVQWKQSTKVTPAATFNGTRRYLIKSNLTSNVQNQLLQDMGTNVDMGVPATLNSFIAWGKKYFPADHYCLVIWDHGNGWLPQQGVGEHAPPAFSYDGQSGHSIQIWQLNQAFANQHVDITAYDCSLMQMDEVAYQMVGMTDYLAGSEESPPGTGYPYQLVFAEFTANPTGSPLTLSKAFVDGMINYPSYDNQKIEQSVVATAQLSGVASATASLRQAMVSNEAALAPIIPGLRNTVQSYLPTTTRYFYDSVDLCNQLSAGTSISSVQTACTSYVAAVNTAIVWEGHNSNSPGSHGLSIDFSPSSFFNTVSNDYTQLAWNTATDWSQWLSIAP